MSIYPTLIPFYPIPTTSTLDYFLIHPSISPINPSSISMPLSNTILISTIPILTLITLLDCLSYSDSTNYSIDNYDPI